MTAQRSLSKNISIGLPLLLAITTPGLATAHGFADQRYFPATLTFDDPFTQDEFGFLYGSMPKVKNEDPNTHTYLYFGS